MIYNTWIVLSVLLFIHVSNGLAFTKKKMVQPSGLSVKIVIPLHGKFRSLYEGTHFHVMITNQTDKTLRLWTDRYSWGYDNLFFEVIERDGKRTKIFKKTKSWNKNFPDWRSFFAWGILYS